MQQTPLNVYVSIQALSLCPRRLGYSGLLIETKKPFLSVLGKYSFFSTRVSLKPKNYWCPSGTSKWNKIFTGLREILCPKLKYSETFRSVQKIEYYLDFNGI